MLERLTVLVLVDDGVLVTGRRQFAAGELDRLVFESLRKRSRRCDVLPFTDVGSLMRAIDEVQPDIVFNLTQHAYDDRLKDGHICALLELRRVAYTGANPRGLMLGRDKALSKRIAEQAGFRVPRFFVVDPGRIKIPVDTVFPTIVKPRYGDSSEGINQASIVNAAHSLVEKIAALRRRGFNDLICEEFISGREMAVGVLGDDIVRPREFFIQRKGRGKPRLACDRFKYDAAYRRRWGIKTDFAKIGSELLRDLRDCTLKTAAALGIRDYGRLDVMLTERDEWVFLEANPNPGLSKRGTTWSGTWDSVNFDAMIAEIAGRAYRRREQISSA